MRGKWKKIVAYIACAMMIMTCVPNIALAESMQQDDTAMQTAVTPVASEVTESSVTLEPVAGYEYSNGGEVWQSENVFSDLKVNTKYVFYQRVAAVDDGEPGPMSNMLEVTTLKYTVDAPPMPTLQYRTDTKISLVHTSGYQYSLDGETWQNPCYFTGLNPGQTYTLYQRVGEKELYYASEKSPALRVKTKSAAVDGDEVKLAAVTDTLIEVAPLDGYEYSTDNENWQDKNVFTDLEPLTAYTIYQRLKETDDQVAGNSVQLKVRTLKAETIPKGYIGIYTKDDLNNVRNQMDGKYILMNNIEFTDADFAPGGKFYNNGEGWQPIGSFNAGPFKGVFNGNGYYISGNRIEVDSDKGGHFGLFGQSQGVIRNLGIVDQNIKVRTVNDSTDVIDHRVGAVVGYNTGYIYNCYSSGVVDSVVEGTYLGNCAGGIAGYSANVILNCYSNSNVRCLADHGHIYGGGICGSGTAKNCYNAGNVEVASRSAAYSNPCAIASGNNANCYSIESVIKDISLKDEWEGKVTYLTENQMCQQESFEGFDFDLTWTIDSNGEYPYPKLKSVTHKEAPENNEEFAGGNGTNYNPFIIKNKEHLNNVRDYLGYSFKMVSDISFDSSDFDKSGWQPIGATKMDGFFGQFDGNGHVIEGIQINTTVDGLAAKGLFGYSNGVIKNLGVINGSYKVTVRNHNVDTYDDTTYVGGIAGVSNGVIKNCYNTNKVVLISKVEDGIYHAKAGGISGSAKLVKDCYNDGYVMASGDFLDTGGITGDGGEAVNCYNTGRVRQLDNSTAEPGGIGPYFTSKNSYSIYVTLPGYGHESNTVFLTRDQMKKQEYYPALDFENVWVMNNEYDYPQLRSVAHVAAADNTTEFAGGNGTESNPYRIKTKDHLKNIENYEYGHFKLMNDIDLSGENWQVLCDSKDDAFCGVLDGNGYTIKGMNVVANDASDLFTAFIGYNDGTIMNLNFEDSSIISELESDTRIFTGTICGYNDRMAVIENCRCSNANVKVASVKNECRIGGIVGYNDGKISTCGISGAISIEMSMNAEGYVGGIAGKNNKKGMIQQSCADLLMEGYHNLSNKNYIYWGGLIGTNGGRINDAFFAGQVMVRKDSLSVANAYVAGAIGFNESEAVAKNIYHCASDITGSTLKNTGHIIASGYNKKIENAYYLNNKELSGTTGVPMASGDMCDSSNFLGFDFENVWEIDNSEGSEFAFPKLRKVSFEGAAPKIGIDKCQVEPVDKKTYVGTALTPDVKVTYKNTLLKEDRDYYLVYKNNKNAGQAIIEIIGIGGYSGETQINFEILPADISGESVTVITEDIVYTGKAIEPAIKIPGYEEGRDYIVAYADNIEPGIATIYVMGEGNYSGKIITEFVIEKGEVSQQQLVGLETKQYKYTGNAVEPEVGLKGFEKDVHYQVVYENNVDVGTASVQITGIGPFTGTRIESFEIVPADISEMSVTLDKTSYVYTGKAIRPAVKIAGLTEGKDFTVTYTDNKDIGTGRITIAGTGNYTGSIISKFTITKPKVPSLTKSTAALHNKYNTIRASWTKVKGVTGYKVMWKKAAAAKWNSKRVSGSYATMSGLTSGAKYTVKIIPYVSVNGKFFEGKGTSRVVYTLKQLNKPSLKKSSAGKVKVSWKNINGETGYQISRALKQTGTNVVATVKTTTGKSKVVKAPKGKTYYYKVRAYKTVNGKKIFGPWSKTYKFKNR